MLKHFFRNLEIRDHTVLHRTNCHDIARGTAKHFFRIAPDGLDLVSHFVDRYDRWFADDDAPALRINKRICGAQIDRQIAGKQTK